MRRMIAPSLLSADFGQLGIDIEMLNNSEADYFHIDVMDGVFVPNISFGFPVLKYINSLSLKPLDVHLMIVDPDRYLQRFRENGAEIISVHYEACTHLHRTISEIKKLGAKAGVALNPHTNVNVLEDIIQEIDLVLIMSVNPGYGGQSFIQNTIPKISKLKDLLAQKKSNAIIEVDGGVGMSNAKELFEAGVDMLVAGNSVFSSDNPKQTIAALKAQY